MEKHRLKVFQNRVLRRIFGPKRKEKIITTNGLSEGVALFEHSCVRILGQRRQ
jgi:hypothetical protein